MSKQEQYNRLRSVYHELLEVLDMPGVSLETIVDINEALIALQRISTRMNLGV